MKANESDASKVAFLDGIHPSTTDWAAVAGAVSEAEWWADADSLLEAVVKGSANGNALRLALELDPSVFREGAIGDRIHFKFTLFTLKGLLPMIP